MKKKANPQKKIKKMKSSLFTFPPIMDTGAITQISTKLNCIEYEKLRYLKHTFNGTNQAIVVLALQHFFNYLTKQKLDL